MSRKTNVPYLRIVTTANSVDVRAPSPDVIGSTALGFLNIAKSSDALFESIIELVKPAWIFDLRPVPYFNIGQLNRMRAFELMRRHNASYQDLSGLLRIIDRNDASLNSGDVAAQVNQFLGRTSTPSAILILLNDTTVLRRAMEILPRTLCKPANGWFPIEFIAAPDANERFQAITPDGITMSSSTIGVSVEPSQN